MSAITTTNAINAIVKLIATQALESLIGNLVMGKLVNRAFEPMLAQTGDTVNVPIAPSLTANNIAENGTITNQTASLGNAQIVLNTHAETSFQIGDIAKALVQPDLAKLYMDAAMKALATRIETDLLNCYVLFTDNTAVGGAAPITEGVVDDAETTLFNSMVPMNAPKYLVVNAGTYSDLRQLPRFSEANLLNSDGSAITDGVVGKIKSFNVIRSQYVNTSGGTHNIAFTPDALALVTRRLPQPLPGTGAIAEYAELGSFGMRVVMSYVPTTLAQQFTVDVLYGVGTLRNQFAVEVTSNT